MYRTITFSQKNVHYEETVNSKGLFSKNIKTKIITKVRLETIEEMMDRITIWINDNNVTDFKIVTVPMTYHYASYNDSEYRMIGHISLENIYSSLKYFKISVIYK
jgi:hypothetical protein